MEPWKTKAVVEALTTAWLQRGSATSVDNRDIYSKLQPQEQEHISHLDIMQVLEYLKRVD